MIAVTLWYAVDDEGNEIPPDMEDIPVAYYGPFPSFEAAVVWIQDYPEDDSIQDMTAEWHDHIDPDILNSPTGVEIEEAPGYHYESDDPQDLHTL